MIQGLTKSQQSDMYFLFHTCMVVCGALGRKGGREGEREKRGGGGGGGGGGGRKEGKRIGEKEGGQFVWANIGQHRRGWVLPYKGLLNYQSADAEAHSQNTTHLTINHH